MKTTVCQPIPIEPELLAVAERVLRGGETLSSFVEQSIRDGIAYRRLQSAFIARGIASRDEARRTVEYVSSSDALARLERLLDTMSARQRHAR
ncbi:YlcI/YnfO family protein [Burkholderia sp. AU15512]|uniref:YlcI/YnfO family protein n=1 Tax=Burkholderia sp. AU15512 TaxID=2015345 RepID=UPI000B7A8E80|nr:YlcI/YnfO family protein [Burkholderia sp. AU15512]OXI21756.1 prevent-host-death protein [Burkholderia sp. AU15512]